MLDSSIGLAENAFAIAPSNDNDLTNPARAIYVGGAGDIKVTTLGGDTVTFTAVPAGTWLPVQCRKVFQTGTDATFMIGVS